MKPSSTPRSSIIALGLLAALAASAAAPRGEVGAVVTMTDTFEFSPRAVTIHAGEAVEWQNASRFIHNVAADPKLGSATVPPGAQAFASGDLQPGARFRRVLSVPGEYRYICTQHEGIGMTGRITVLQDGK